MFRAIFSSTILCITFLYPGSLLACDDKSCESAYLAETRQHIANQVRRAQAWRQERHAYSKNRERRAFALFRHIHNMHPGQADPTIFLVPIEVLQLPESA